MSRTLEALRKIESRASAARVAEMDSVEDTLVSEDAFIAESESAAVSTPAAESAFVAQASAEEALAQLQAMTETPRVTVPFPMYEPPVPEPLDAPEPVEIRWPYRTPGDTHEELATRLLAHRIMQRPAVLMFTSPDAGDGKTELLISLAPVLAAQARCRVLLVDADFEKADLSARLALPTTGLAGVLGGDLPLHAAICPTTTQNLFVMPQGHSWQHQADAPDLAAWESTLDNLKQRNPVVLLDAEPLTHPHVALRAASCDGVCLVIRPGHTLRRATREAAALICQTGGNLLGCIAVGG